MSGDIPRRFEDIQNMIAGILVFVIAITLIVYLVVVSSHRNKQRMYTDEEKRYILHDAVFYEIVFAFGVSPYDETDYCAWEHVNFSRMGHARALYDFFETSKKKRDKRGHDDVVSEDFGFPAHRIQRLSEDRKRLNKDLFHLSYERLRHLKALKDKPWPDTILGCLHEPCVEFIKSLLTNKNKFGKSSDFIKWEQLLKGLTSGCEMRVSAAFANDEVLSYSFKPGRQLQSGRSELTKPIAQKRATGSVL